MKKLHLFLLVSVLIGVMLFALGCSTQAPSQPAAPPENNQEEVGEEAPPEAEPVELMVSAAASLTDAMEELKQLYTSENSHVTITYNFGSSGSLQQQIEQGAPADLFLSAAQRQMNALKDGGIVAEEDIVQLLENKVVVVSSLDTEGVQEFADLAKEEVTQIAVGEPESVPVGQYTMEILTSLGIVDQITPKVIYAKDVREVLTWVETGNVQAGVVYATDAKISGDKIKIGSAAPEGTHAPVIYPAAVIKSSENQEEAKAFLAFLTGAEAKAVFEKYGFTRVE